MIYINCVLVFICLFFGSSHARTFGGLDSPQSYIESISPTPNQGVLEIIAYTELVSQEREMFRAAPYEVELNGIKVAEVRQSFLDTLKQSGKFNYLRLDLPNGLYQVAVREIALFSDGSATSFSVIVRDGKKISIEVKNKEVQVRTSAKRFLGDFRLADDAQVNQAEYQKIFEMMWREADSFKVKEIVALNRQSTDLQNQEIKRLEDAHQMAVQKEIQDATEKAISIKKEEEEGRRGGCPCAQRNATKRTSVEDQTGSRGA
jgi:hypothetical protein